MNHITKKKKEMQKHTINLKAISGKTIITVNCKNQLIKKKTKSFGVKIIIFHEKKKNHSILDNFNPIILLIMERVIII